MLLSRLLRRGEDIWAHDEDDEEEVVYVFVDDDGVEHEISADEAEDYEIVEVTRSRSTRPKIAEPDETTPRTRLPHPKRESRAQASRLNALKSVRRIRL